MSRTDGVTVLFWFVLIGGWLLTFFVARRVARNGWAVLLVGGIGSFVVAIWLAWINTSFGT